MSRNLRNYNGHSRRRGRLAFVICLVIVVVVLAVVAFFILRTKGAPGFAEVPLGDRFDSAALSGTLSSESAGDLNEPGEFQYRINQKITVEKGSANLRLENPAENRQNMRVNITLPDGTVLYESGLIKPFHYIESARLQNVPKKGTYTALAKISAYDSLTDELLSTAEQELEINV